MSSVGRSVSLNDVKIAVKVFGLYEQYENLSYRDAVARVSADTNYAVKTVYDMAARARNDPRTLEALKELKERQVERGGVAQVDTTHKGFNVTGKSTLFNAQGEVQLEWVKTNLARQNELELLNALIETLEHRVTPQEPIPLMQPYQSDGLLTLYPIADFHLGLYATALDGGGKWNLAKAVGVYKNAIDDLVARSPFTIKAIVANVGDFTHSDNATNRTPKSNAPLDVDGRFFEVAHAAMDLSTYIIDAVAAHHAEVEVVWQPGNHDEGVAIVIQAALAQSYKHDPRINILTTVNRTHVIQWNQVALGFTHGDTIKLADLPLLMAVDYAKIWAETTYRVWHTGHTHHRKVEEFKGCDVEVHRSPTVRDAWHDAQGYRSKRSISSIVYNSNSEYARNTVHLG